jgi:adenylosuccinate synthase
VAYRTPDGEVEEFPADTWILDQVEPVFETLPGWESPTGDATSLEDLPGNARAYLDRIEELTGAPVGIVSVGTRRRQTIHVDG